MKPLAEMIPSMTGPDLVGLRLNAERLRDHGSPAQKTAAGDILPVISDELARRAALEPPKAVRKAPVRKKKVADIEAEV